jgi:hypothetical protein
VSAWLSAGSSVVAFDQLAAAYFASLTRESLVPADRCLIDGCTFKAYAPAGTGALCKDHFLQFVTWRRRKGPTMFFKYGAMRSEERDTLVVEWQKTVKAE